MVKILGKNLLLGAAFLILGAHTEAQALHMPAKSQDHSFKALANTYLRDAVDVLPWLAPSSTDFSI